MTVNFNNEKLAKHQTLANNIKSSLKCEGGSIREEESHSAYFGNLPESLTKEVVEDVAKYNGAFVSAAHVAIGELAAEAFVGDKDLERVNAKIGMFGKHDKLTASVHRQKQYLNNYAEKEEDKTIVKHLVIQSTVETSGYGIKSIRDAMSEEFKDRFSGK